MLTQQWDAPLDGPITLQQLLQRKTSGCHRPPVATQQLLVELHGDGAPVDELQEVLVHVDDVPGREAVLGLLSRHHGGAVHLKLIEGVGAEGGGFLFAQQLQRWWRQSSSNDLQLHQVLSRLQVDGFLIAFCGGREPSGPVDHVSELSWTGGGRNRVKAAERTG